MIVRVINKPEGVALADELTEDDMANLKAKGYIPPVMITEPVDLLGKMAQLLGKFCIETDSENEIEINEGTDNDIEFLKSQGIEVEVISR